MGVVSVRLDHEIDALLTDLAQKRSVSKSDMIRILIIRGLEMDPKSNEVLNEILENLLSTNSFIMKNFKVVARVLANTNLLMELTGNSDEKILEAQGKARAFLEKHGVME